MQQTPPISIRLSFLPLVYSSNINISFFHSADEFKIVRQQRTQFALIFARISEEFLTSGFEFGKRFEVLDLFPLITL